MFQIKKNTNRRLWHLPKGVEDVLPLHHSFPDGMVEARRGRYGVLYAFTDIPMALMDEEGKEKVFSLYEEILNSLDSGAQTKILAVNRPETREQQIRRVKISMQRDRYDEWRCACNEWLEGEMKKAPISKKSTYLSVFIDRKSPEEAKSYFERCDREFALLFSKMGSLCRRLSEEETLRFYYDFFHVGREEEFLFVPALQKNELTDASLLTCPQELSFGADHFTCGGRYGRVLYLHTFANYLKDSFLEELCPADLHLVLSLDIQPMETGAAIRKSENKLLSMESNIAGWRRKQLRGQNPGAAVPYSMERQREESREILENLTSRDMRLLPTLVTLVLTSPTKEKLESDTEKIRSAAKKHMCRMEILHYQMREGLVTTLPYGENLLPVRRTLTTESLAALLPFHFPEIEHEGGCFRGLNQLSGRPVFLNRDKLLNKNAIVCGVSGSGKSLLAKEELIQTYVSDPSTDLLVIDPEREYRKLCEALGGEYLEISSTSSQHINALDMEEASGGEDHPLVRKCEFLLSLFEELTPGIGPAGKSILDRCVKSLYVRFGSGKRSAPTLRDLYDLLLLQPEPEAKDMALGLELFSKGSLNVFAHPTNTNLSGRLIVLDIHSLSKSLQPIGMLILLETVWNRILKNDRLGRKTMVFIDEIYLLFRSEYAANYLLTLWKRARKYRAGMTGITQNVEDLLSGPAGRVLLSNSEYTLLLSQAPTDRQTLKKLLSLTDREEKYITDAPAGQGLLLCGGAHMPFVNHLPGENPLYGLVATDPKGKEDGNEGI